MRRSITWFVTILMIASLWRISVGDAHAEGVLVDRVTFDGNLDSQFGVVEVLSRGGTYFTGNRNSVMHESVSLLPSIYESYLRISGFEDVMVEGTITFWARAYGRGSVDGLRVFELSCRGEKPSAAHTLSLYTDSTIEVTILDTTYHNQSFNAKMESHDPYRWNLYVYSYSMLTGDVKIAVNSNWVMEFDLPSDVLIEPATVIQLGRVEIGNGNSLRLDDFRVYDGQLSLEDISSILNEPKVSLSVEIKDSGVHLSVINSAGTQYSIERNGHLGSPVWDRVFIGDRRKTNETFVDSTLRARNGVFYRLRFPR